MTELGRQVDGLVPEALRRHVESQFSRRQMAAAYGCDPETITRWADSGQLPRPVRYGGRDFWTLESLETHRQKRALQAQGATDRITRIVGEAR